MKISSFRENNDGYLESRRNAECSIVSKESKNAPSIYPALKGAGFDEKWQSDFGGVQSTKVFVNILPAV